SVDEESSRRTNGLRRPADALYGRLCEYGSSARFAAEDRLILSLTHSRCLFRLCDCEPDLKIWICEYPIMHKRHFATQHRRGSVRYEEKGDCFTISQVSLRRKSSLP